MEIDSCYRMGRVIKRHGIKGEVKVYVDSPIPKKLESIFVIQNNRLIPFFIEGASFLPDQVILKLEDVDTPEQATALLNADVYLPLSIKPKRRKDDFTEPAIIGFKVVHNKKTLGTVKRIDEHALNPLIVINSDQGEILIPMNDYFIKEVREDQRQIKVELPEGFLDI